MTEREPRLYDAGFLKFLQTKPCCICGRVGETEACHIRIGLFAGQMKPHDRYATPMCRDHHRLQHSMSEVVFWENHQLNPFDIAGNFYRKYGGTGGKPRAPRKVKPRKPKAQRTKIKGSSQWSKPRKIPSRKFRASSPR